jgi:hypothetical protein
VKNFRLALLLSLGFGLTNCADKSDPGNTVFPSNTVTIPERGVSRLETSQDFDPLLAELGPARYALLGEASHGTSEFYTQRAALTKRLIEEKGFTLIGVEGDWPELYELNRYVKGANNGASAAAVLQRRECRFGVPKSLPKRGRVWASHNHRTQLRRRRGPSAGSCSGAPSGTASWPRRRLQCRAKRPAGRKRGAVLPNRGPQLLGFVEHPRPAHGRNHQPADELLRPQR